MRATQAPTLTVSKPAPKCPKCGAQVLLARSNHEDRYYPIAVFKRQGADPDSGVRWVWNQDLYVDKKPSWLYWLFGFQWLSCPHCGEKLSRLGRQRNLSVYPVVELPSAPAQEPAATDAAQTSEQPAHATTPEDEDTLNYDSTYDRNYAVYDPKLDQHSPQRLTLVADLRHAIDADQLVLHYQPTVNIKTRQVTTAQALVRWQHPQYDLMSPDDFIPLAERTGLIKPLTLWVLDHALRQQGTWKKEGFDLSVAVNMSAHGLLDLELPDLIAGLLTRHKVSADRLILEITGTSKIMDQQRALQILTRLTDMGVRLSLDDFGIGYSTLAQLSELPVREIKIDKSYVLDMVQNPEHAMIVRTTVDLVRNLGLEAIGEGAANEETFTELEKLGCDAVQDSYISQPLSAEEFSRWIQESPWPP